MVRRTCNPERAFGLGCLGSEGNVYDVYDVYDVYHDFLFSPNFNTISHSGQNFISPEHTIKRKASCKLRVELQAEHNSQSKAHQSKWIVSRPCTSSPT